jgi:hypothetical protein
MYNEFKWDILKFSNPDIEKAHIGDIFAVQNKETGQIDGRYIKINGKKRGFQSIDEGGYVSVYDIKSMHLPECKIVYYANAQE